MRTELLTVSDGERLYQIESDSLDSAQQQGFYRPGDRGMTIVDDGQHLFEVPIAETEAAIQSGMTDVLSQERHPAPKPLAKLRKIANPSNPNISSQELVVGGLSLAEQEAQQKRIDDEEELEAASGLSWYTVFLRQWFGARRETLLRQLRGNGISVAIHVAIFLLLASLALVSEEDKNEVSLVASQNISETIQEVVIEPEPLEITEPTESESEEAPPESEPEIPMTTAVTPNYLAAISGDAVKPPAKPSKDDGNGKDTPMKKSSVFGTKNSAKDYVFVIDNSNSMQRGRFETALNELITAVNGLNAKQRFYVIFYSDTAYGMLHPRAVTQMVPATHRNKQQLFYWLRSVELCLKTNGKEAIQAGFNMKPDVMYILGDGAFTDGAAQHFIKMPKTKTIVHTRGMQVQGKDAKSFEALAKAHGGNYKDVGVSPQGLQVWKQNPRPRNNTRGYVWGIKLPVKKKK